jgi:hypothetical protein
VQISRPPFDSKKEMLSGTSTGDAVCVSPSIRRVSREPLEHRAEMSLSLEADGQCDLDKRHGGLAQQFFGTLDSSPQKILMGSKTGRGPELRGEVHSAQSRHGGQIEKRDFSREMIVDKFDDPLEALIL